MIVTENGLGAYDKLTEDGKVHDQYRIEYLRKHIEQIQLAITEMCIRDRYNKGNARRKKECYIKN